MKYLTHILLVVSTMFDTRKKYTILHYGLSRNPGNNFGKAV